MDPTSDSKYSYDDPEVNYGPPSYSQQGREGSQMTAYPPVPQSSQMASQSNVTVVVNQPTSAQNPLMATTLDGTRTWTTGLFDCFSDVLNCVFTCFCYCCAVSSLSSRMGECCCTPCCIPGAEIVIRNRIRTVGGIRGSMCDDCMVVACCGPCAACQEARELTNMGIP